MRARKVREAETEKICKSLAIKKIKKLITKCDVNAVSFTDSQSAVS